ncbi:threonine-phosphate decarboxylase, partial [Pseudomonas aeruginosa]|nr:threonine-phosphate decarboxylase [Pseudomonas aeruginosa]
QFSLGLEHQDLVHLAFLARRGILTRQFEQPASLRLGLPADEAAWARLDAALLGFKEPAHE